MVRTCRSIRRRRLCEDAAVSEREREHDELGVGEHSNDVDVNGRKKDGRDRMRVKRQEQEKGDSCPASACAASLICMGTYLVPCKLHPRPFAYAASKGVPPQRCCAQRRRRAVARAWVVRAWVSTGCPTRNAERDCRFQLHSQHRAGVHAVLRV